VRLSSAAAVQDEAGHGGRAVTDADLPEGVRILLIMGLELCGAVLAGDPPEAVYQRADVMRLAAAEHIDLRE
jgi:hypothetical protein